MLDLGGKRSAHPREVAEVVIWGIPRTDDVRNQCNAYSTLANQSGDQPSLVDDGL